MTFGGKFFILHPNLPLGIKGLEAPLHRNPGRVDQPQY